MRKPGRRKPSFPKPSLTVERILEWADDFHASKGRWPKTTDGAVSADRNEKWLNIDIALRDGYRGLPGGGSLARLLQRERGVRNKHGLPPLTEDGILAWAEAHHDRTERWPHENSGYISDAPGERRYNVNASLREGSRGLPGGDTLSRLLFRRFGWAVLDPRTTAAPELPPLTPRKIRAWRRGHRELTGRWPGPKSGAVAGAPGETWKAIDLAMLDGLRGLPPGGSLAELLRRMGAAPAKHRPKPRVRSPSGGRETPDSK